MTDPVFSHSGAPKTGTTSGQYGALVRQLHVHATRAMRDDVQQAAS